MFAIASPEELGGKLARPRLPCARPQGRAGRAAVAPAVVDRPARMGSGRMFGTALWWGEIGSACCRRLSSALANITTFEHVVETDPQSTVDVKLCRGRDSVRLRLPNRAIEFPTDYRPPAIWRRPWTRWQLWTGKTLGC